MKLFTLLFSFALAYAQPKASAPTPPQLRICNPDSSGAIQVPLAFTVPIVGSGFNVAIVQCARLDLAVFRFTAASSSSPAILSVVTGAQSALPTFAEVPTGAIDGVNLKFSLAAAPNPANSLVLIRNGLIQQQGVDYTLAGNVITFVSSVVTTPQIGDSVVAVLYMH